MEKAIYEKTATRICNKYHYPTARFHTWLHQVENKQGYDFMRKLNDTIEELLNSQIPKTLDYEVKDELKQKEMTTLLFKKFCDYQKFRLYHGLRAN